MKRIAAGAAMVVAALVAVYLVIGGLAFVFSWKSCPEGFVCIVTEDGPFDGRATIEIRRGGGSGTFVGAFNNQWNLPTTQRDWSFSSDKKESDSRESDRVEVSTADAVLVYPEGSAIFRLTDDTRLIREFVQKYGRRPWDGKELWTEQGWRNFLRIRFRPIITESLREAIGKKNCISLNNLCQYIVQAEAAVRGRINRIDNTQDLQEAQQEVTSTITAGIRKNLGGDYFEEIGFQNLRIGFDQDVLVRIKEAQAKQTEIATARLEAQRALAAAIGVTKVRREEGRQIKLTAGAYERNPYQAKIDLMKAMCGASGCTNLQVIGGGSDVITSLR